MGSNVLLVFSVIDIANDLDGIPRRFCMVHPRSRAKTVSVEIEASVGFKLSIRWLRVRVPSPSLNRSGRKQRVCGHCRFRSYQGGNRVW